MACRRWFDDVCLAVHGADKELADSCFASILGIVRHWSLACDSSTTAGRDVQGLHGLGNLPPTTPV